MSDYVRSINHTAKDALSVGDPNKKIKGSEMDSELDAVATASATKSNKAIPAVTGNVASLTSTGDLQDSGVTSTELAILDGATVTTAELNILDGVTSTAAELNILDGVTATAAELNYTDGVTSSIQTQLDAKIETVTASDITDDAITSAKLESPAAGTTYLIGTVQDTALSTAQNPYASTDSTRQYASDNSITVTVLVPGVITASLEHKSAGTFAYARILKNGVAQGSWSTISTTYTARSVDITVAVGDIIMFQQYDATAGGNAWWRNLHIHSNNASMAVA